MTDLIAETRSELYAPYGFLSRLGGAGADWIAELAAELRTLFPYFFHLPA